jgi:hypothetical protein
MIAKEVQDLYWQLLLDRILDNTLTRDVFAATVVQPSGPRSAEDLYRCVVWNLWHQAREEGWRVPMAEEIAEGALPFFALRQQGECILVERARE